MQFYDSPSWFTRDQYISREATQIAKDESSVTQAILSNAADENAQAKEAYRRWAIEHLAQED